MKDKSIFRSITGSELQSIASADLVKRLIDTGYVAENAFLATKKIRDYNGVAANENGDNVECIELVRKKLSQLESVCTANAFLIIAPHTHWRRGEVITIYRSTDIYSIGPHAIDKNSLYFPVSFCITDRGFEAFEWAHESIFVGETSLFSAYGALEMLEKEIQSVLPIGISLNFKFKRLISEQIVAVTEHTPYDDIEGNSPTAIIERSESFHKRHLNAEVEQVAWVAFKKPERSAGFLKEFVKMLESDTHMDKQKLFNEINSIIGEKEELMI